MTELHANDRPRLIILDNSIVGLGGHFLDYALAVLTASRSRGYSPALVAHRTFRDVVPRDVWVERLYRFDNWPLAARAPVVRWLRLNLLRKRDGSPTRSRRGAPVRPSLLGTLREHYGRLDLAVRSREFERGTTTAFERLRPQLRDIIFLPNPWIPELQGLAVALKRYKASAVSVHLVLRREFGESESAALAGGLRRLAGGAADNQVHFYTDTPELTRLYTETFGLEFRTLPIPHPIMGARGKAGSGAIQVCYSGDARSEKGFAALPELVSRVLKEFGTEQTIRFIVQANAPSTGMERDAREALASLRTLDTSLVTLITESQERSAYEETILNSDVVLLPYKAEHYRYRSSGVLIEAMSAGVPALVPEQTWLANELRRFRQAGHPSVPVTDGLPGASYSSEADAGEKFVYMLRHLQEFQAVARECAAQVRTQHNAENVINALTESARSAMSAAEEAMLRNAGHGR